MTRQPTLDQLKELLKTHSVKRGDFVLASGKRSNVYVDARLTTLQAQAMPLIGRAFLEKMRQRGWRPAAIGGLTMGADPIVTAVARESLEFDWRVNAFLVRKEAKDHGRLGYMVGLDETEGLDVVIVDDVCTTGGSTVLAIGRAREAGMNVLGAICLVDREQGGRESIEGEHKCPFDRLFTMKELVGE
jgi:orotate phosphoribosyltransferase